MPLPKPGVRYPKNVLAGHGRCIGCPDRTLAGNSPAGLLVHYPANAVAMGRARVLPPTGGQKVIKGRR